MLTPTHIQVAVLRTKDLIIKGKNGTNDAFIIFALGKQKFQSSIKEKASSPMLEWNEGCDMIIPQGNKTELVLKLVHKASMGEKFLGRTSIPLSDFDPMAKVVPKWYPLRPKPEREKDDKYRGEIEVKISFLIKSNASESMGELASKSKRNSLRSSLGSILSLGKKKSKKDKSGSSKDSLSSSTDSLKINSSRLNLNNNLPIINDDPGVISEEEDEVIQFGNNNDTKSMQSNTSLVSGSYSEKIDSLPSTPKLKSGFRGLFASKSGSIEEDLDDNRAVPKPRTVRLPSVIVEEDSSGPPPITVTTAPPTPQPPPKKLTVSASMSNLMDAGKIGNGKKSVGKSFKAMFTSSKHLSVDEIYNPSVSGYSNHNASQQKPQSPVMKRVASLRDLKIPKETFKVYDRKSKEELIALIISLQDTVDTQKHKIRDLEDYIDKLLLRVLDNMPVLLKKGNSIRGN